MSFRSGITFQDTHEFFSCHPSVGKVPGRTQDWRATSKESVARMSSSLPVISVGHVVSTESEAAYEYRNAPTE